VAAILEASRDADTSRRSAAFRALALMQPLPRVAYPRILEAASDPEISVRLPATASLGWIRPFEGPAEIALATALNDAQPSVRAAGAAAAAVAGVQAANLLPHLRQVAESDSGQAQTNAARAVLVIEGALQDRTRVGQPEAQLPGPDKP
jgi:hypothetical protein